MDVDAILAIPLSTRCLNDSWAWHYEKNGLLLVRSVYHLLVQTKRQHEDWLEGRSAGSNTVAEGRNWQCLWKTMVPSKVHVFLWHLAQHSLPSADIRHHRNMSPSSACSICGAEGSWRHSLLNYAMARSVWALADEGITEYVCMNEDTDTLQTYL
jgi:hypothetical protein